MKKIVIMGASSGIGYALAETFASRGVTVGLASRNTEPLRQLQQKYPGVVHYSSIDINSEEAVEKLERLIATIGGMDIYIHASGIGYDNPELNPEREVQILTTNVCGFARMVSTAYRYFRQKKVSGQIAAITSVAGVKGIAQMAAYSASKRCDQTYLVALEQLARREKVDVSFTDIRPGWIKTALVKEGYKYPMEMELEYVVPQILKALIHKKRIAVIDWRWKILVSLWRLVPDALWLNTKMSFESPE